MPQQLFYMKPGVRMNFSEPPEKFNTEETAAEIFRRLKNIEIVI